MKNITDFNELIYAGAKLVCEKIGVSLKKKKHEQQIKTWMGNSTGNSDKKFTTTSKNDKLKEKCWDKKEKATQVKMTI